MKKLRIHSKKVHNITVYKEECKICDRKFAGPQSLQKHISTFHCDMPYSCNNCDAAFAHKRKLDRHKASIHGEKKPYVCKICDTLYLDKQCLQKHIKTAHADILPLNFGVAAINELIKTDAPVEIKCEICCLVFESNGKLKEHQNEKHKSGKQICCHYCDWKASEKQQAKPFIPSTIKNICLCFGTSKKREILMPELTGFFHNF